MADVIRVPVSGALLEQMAEWQREATSLDRLMGVALRRQLVHGADCWHCRLLRKKAAIATVGFEVGLVEFDWPAHRSVRIVVDDPTYFQQPGAQFILDRTGRMFEVFAVDGDGLRCVPR